MRRGVACRALHATSLWLLGFRSGCSETVSRVGCGSRTRTIDPYPRTVLRRAQGKRKVRVHGAPCRWCCVQRHYRDACLRRAAPIPDYSGSGCAVGKRPNAHGPALMRPAMSLQGRFAQCHLQGRSTAALRAAGSRCKAPLPPAVRRARQVEQDLWERRSRRRDVRPAGPHTSLRVRSHPVHLLGTHPASDVRWCNPPRRTGALGFLQRKCDLSFLWKKCCNLPKVVLE